MNGKAVTDNKSSCHKTFFRWPWPFLMTLTFDEIGNMPKSYATCENIWIVIWIRHISFLRADLLAFYEIRYCWHRLPWKRDFLKTHRHNTVAPDGFLIYALKRCRGYLMWSLVLHPDYFFNKNVDVNTKVRHGMTSFVKRTLAIPTITGGNAQGIWRSVIHQTKGD